MYMKLCLLSCFVLVLALGGAVQGGAPLPVENHSFEFDKNGEQITEQTWIGDVNAWILRDTGSMSGWWFVSVGENYTGFEATDGNAASVCATLHDWPDTILEIYQIIDANTDANAIIAENRRYTLTFNAIDTHSIVEPDVNAVLFVSTGEGEPNDVILASQKTTLTAPNWEDPEYAGWEEIKLYYVALPGDGNIGKSIGLKFNIPIPWYNGVFVAIDNVRMDWAYLTDAWNPYPADGATEVPRDANLIWSPGLWAKDTNGHDVYFGSTWAEVNSATTASAEFIGNRDANEYDPGTMVLGTTYYWRIDEVNENYTPGPVPIPPNGRWKGQVWSFTIEGLAKNPHPEDGATGVPKNVILRWSPGIDAKWHDVYFGTSEATVTAATTASPEYKIRTNLGTEQYDAGTNENPQVGEQYFWRIDEVNTITVKGHVWDFTVANYILIDDFDFYANHTELRTVWKDYYSAIGGDGVVWLNKDANYAVDGNSMLFEYWNNSSPYYSETRRDYSTGQDWSYSGNGVTALEIDFIGDMNSAMDPPMYVKLSDGTTTAQVNHTDFNEVLEEEIHTWVIPLKDFSGVTLSSITSITLGIGDKVREAAGPDEEGTVYFDDMRLYPPRCIPEVTGAAQLHAVGDFTTAHHDGQDCITDYLDLEIMAERDWLMSGANVPPSEPDTNATLWYKFDEGSGTTTANSGSLGSTYNGILINGPVWSTDAHPNDGNSLDFDGSDDGVYVADSPNMTGDNSVTFTAWVKREGSIDAYKGVMVMSRDEGSEGENGTGIHTDKTGTNALGYTWNNWQESWGWDSGLVIPLDEWVFVALTVEPTQGIMYLAEPNAIDPNIYDLHSATNVWYHDGLSEYGETGGWDGTSPIYLGRDDPNKSTDYTFPGKISDIRVYDYTLTRGEIMYLAGVGGTAYVPLEDWRADIDDDDRVDLTDYATLADNWLKLHLWPEP
ncbi:MAG: LamG domain-containing protein [Planctomycetota bacterium]|nr:MAG: LamG domain-containing protein [Planctomycetota bacterium]